VEDGEARKQRELAVEHRSDDEDHDDESNGYITV
jgi:hypothetical protein